SAVEVKGCIGHLDNQGDVFRPRTARKEMGKIAFQDDRIRLRFVDAIVAGRYVDGGFMRDEPATKTSISHRTIKVSEFTWGCFLPILSIRSPSINSRCCPAKESGCLEFGKLLPRPLFSLGRRDGMHES